MPPEPDTLPLLPPPSLDEPPSFDSHPEFHSGTLPRTHLQSAPASTPTYQTTLPSPAYASLPPAYTPARYRGHASEEEYLAALRAWAEEKMYTQPSDKSQLVGFYGPETMRERIARGPPPLKGWGGRKKGEGEVGEEGKRRRRSSIGNWLSRKRMG